MEQQVIDITKGETWNQLRDRINTQFLMLRERGVAPWSPMTPTAEDHVKQLEKNAEEDFNLMARKNGENERLESVIRDLREQIESTSIADLRQTTIDQFTTIKRLRNELNDLKCLEPPTQYMEVEKLHTKIRAAHLKNVNQYVMIQTLNGTILDLQKEIKALNGECKDGTEVEDRLTAINTELRKANETLSLTVVEQQNLIKVPQADRHTYPHAFTPYGEIRQRGLTIKMMGEKMHEKRQLVAGLRAKCRYWKAKYDKVIAHLEKPCGRRHVTKVMDGLAAHGLPAQKPYDAWNPWMPWHPDLD